MAKKTAAPVTTALVPAVQADLDFVKTASSGIATFITNLIPFFIKASQIEAAALAVLAEAKTWTKPTSPEQQAALQLQIQRCNRGKGVAEDHWDGTKTQPGITKLLHNVHRRSTSRRDVSINALEEAARIGNALNNQFTREENEKAENERRRLQAIEDAKAEARRQEELIELEKAALAREATSADLSEREKAWVEMVATVESGDALSPYKIRAAKALGYQDPDAAVRRFMKAGGKVALALTARQEAMALRRQATAVKAAPLETHKVDVASNATKASGTSSRTTRSARIVDAEKLVAAVFAGDVPRDVLMINETRLNQYARQIDKAIFERWPGVAVVEDTKVV